MSFNKTMYLLSLLYSAASDEKRSQLGVLFQDVMGKTDAFQQLTKQLQTTTFLGNEGIIKKQEASQALENALAHIQDGPNSITKMELLFQQIEREVQKSDLLVNCSRFFDDELVAVSSEKYDVYTQFYRGVANAICYYLVSQYGVKAIRNLTFNQRAGFSELVRLINQQYANELAMSSDMQMGMAWRIVRTAYVGDNLIPHDGYTIEYTQMKLSEMLHKVELEEYTRIAPYCFAATSAKAEIPLIGIGYLIGVPPENALQLLDADIVTMMPAASLNNADFFVGDTLSVITKSVQTDNFCISPEDLVRAWNRGALTNVVAGRRNTRACIICGRALSGTQHACLSHFRMNQR